MSWNWQVYLYVDFKNKYSSTTPSVTGWIHGGRPTNTESTVELEHPLILISTAGSGISPQGTLYLWFWPVLLLTVLFFTHWSSIEIAHCAYFCFPVCFLWNHGTLLQSKPKSCPEYGRVLSFGDNLTQRDNRMIVFWHSYVLEVLKNYSEVPPGLIIFFC